MKQKNNEINDLDRFFSVVSKIIIFVPIVILIIALFYKFNKTAGNITNLVKNPLPTAAPKIATDSSSTKINFDLKGPYQCSFSSNGTDIKIYAKNKNVLIKVVGGFKAGTYLLKGDCLYIFDTPLPGSTQKVCNMTPYVGFLENMLTGSLPSFESFAQQYTQGKIDIKGLFNSCKKKDFSDEILKIKS